jgi:translation initiation factor 1
MPNDDRRLVYSTDGSIPLPRVQSERKAKARPKKPGIPDDGVIRVGLERLRGSHLTLVYGLEARESDAVGKELRRRCSTGGTTKNGIVQLQGDHRERVLAYFNERGRHAKRAGG